MANETLQHISQNPDERARYRSRRIWLQDREHEHAVWTDEVRAEYEPIIAELASKNAELVSKDAELAALRAQLDAFNV